ncbi:MAG: AAA family ATPase [Clostridia bacterium]|nr:AAA family ATPase [Clostridia bacterium]
MKIRRIYFKDFGIFRDQGLEEIPDLVVISGPNRAGKTTFMTALRYLGYGLPKKWFIPPAQRGQPEFNADVETDEGSMYNIEIQGYARPRVSPLKGSPPMDLEDLYVLEGFTYRQVFTISLDELKKIPEGLESGEQQYLNMALLESGFYNALRLTKIREELKKKAYSIGRKRGSKNTGQFRSYWLTIKEGMEELNEANKQRDLYFQKKEELARLSQREIPEISRELDENRRQLERLVLLRDLYERYGQWLILKEKINRPQNRHLLDTYPRGKLEWAEDLSRRYSACVEEYEQCLREYNYPDNKDKFDQLLMHADVLETYSRELSGWKEKLNNYIERDILHKKTERELKKKLKEINSRWGEKLEILAQLNFDSSTEELLRKTAEDYSSSKRRLKDIIERKKQLELKITTRENSKKELEETNKLPKSLPGIVLAGILFCISAAYFFNPLTAAALGLVLSSGILIYYFFFQAQSARIKSKYDALENEIKHLKDELSELCAEENKLQNSLTNLSSQLTEIKNNLGLDTNIPFHHLWDLSREIKSLKEQYENWLQEQKELKEMRNQLISLLRRGHETLSALKYNVSKNEQDAAGYSIEIFALIEKAVNEMEKAKKLHGVIEKKKQLEEEITALLWEENPLYSPPSEAQKIKEDLASFMERGTLFEKLKEDEGSCRELQQALLTALNVEKRRYLLQDLIPEGNGEKEISPLALLGSLYEKYATKNEVENEIAVLERKIHSLEEELERAKEKKTALEIEMQDLSSDKKLHRAYNKIYSARNSLERLAESYAVYRLAAMMIQGVQEALIEKTKSEFLDTASSIFHRLTAGEYEKIIIDEKEGDIDFLVIPSGSGSEMTADILSRATKEQLFLTIRLSRIKGIKPPLPVIFDDSLVNFDPIHRRQAVNIILELVKTNQVFVLTCHPELLEDLKETCGQALYWRLDRGKFSGPYKDCDEIIHWLEQYNTGSQ